MKQDKQYDQAIELYEKVLEITDTQHNGRDYIYPCQTRRGEVFLAKAHASLSLPGTLTKEALQAYSDARRCYESAIKVAAVDQGEVGAHIDLLHIFDTLNMTQEMRELVTSLRNNAYAFRHNVAVHALVHIYDANLQLRERNFTEAGALLKACESGVKDITCLKYTYYLHVAMQRQQQGDLVGAHSVYNNLLPLATSSYGGSERKGLEFITASTKWPPGFTPLYLKPLFKSVMKVS